MLKTNPNRSRITCLFVLSVLSILLILFNITSGVGIFLIAMLGLGINDLITYMKYSRVEDYLLSLSSFAIPIIYMLLFIINDPLALPFCILFWMFFILLTKLYLFNYEKNWEVKFFLFLTLGIFTSINVAYSTVMQVLFLGVFFFLVMLFEFFE